MSQGPWTFTGMTGSVIGAPPAAVPEPPAPGLPPPLNGPSTFIPSLTPPCISGSGSPVVPEPPVPVVSGPIPAAPGSIPLAPAGAWAFGVEYSSLHAVATTTGKANAIKGREILMVGLQGSLIAGEPGNEGNVVPTLTSYLSS